MPAVTQSDRNPVALGVSYFGNRNPSHFTKDAKLIRENGCNAVLHTFSENDQLFYKKTMIELARISREEGLRVGLDPWGVGRVFSGEATSEFAFKNRRVCQIFQNGESAPAACVNNPEFLIFMEQWITDVAEIGVDFVFWDEPRFHIAWGEQEKPERQVCWCQCCRDKFVATTGLDFPAASEANLQAFKNRSLQEFISRVCQFSSHANLKNTICLLPCETERTGAEHWEEFAAIPHLDTFGTSPYWRAYEVSVLPYVDEQCRRIAQLASNAGKESEIWIQSYKIPAGAEGELTLAIETAYSRGIRSIWAWSFFGTGYMSYIACENPALAWAHVGEAYRHILSLEAL
jgi:hypothetical protein